MELPVGIDHDPLIWVHKAGPDLQRRGGEVGGIADDGEDAGGVGLHGGGRRGVDVGRHAVDLHQREDRGVGPDLDRLEGARGLLGVDDGHMGLVAGGGRQLAGRGGVEVLHQLGFDDEIALPLQEGIEADGVDLAKGGVGVGGVFARGIEDAVFVDRQLGGEHVVCVQLEEVAGGGVVEADAVGGAGVDAEGDQGTPRGRRGERAGGQRAAVNAAGRGPGNPARWPAGWLRSST